MDGIINWDKKFVKWKEMKVLQKYKKLNKINK